MVASIFTQVLFDKICDQLADGKSLREICEKKGMPNRKTFHVWCKNSQELKAQYDEACLDREDAIFDDILYIGDTAKDSKLGKLAMDAKQWTLARMNRKKYGNHITEEMVGANGGPIQIERVRLNMAPVEELPE
ncbi:hypothetical protein ABH944_004846 [Caballeronia udeis]|uniref:Terminase small subunit n=1 Tax=Caballeronia udeis TaxID=1232866 RepID=A0ABW8MLV5_9BURK